MADHVGRQNKIGGVSSKRLTFCARRRGGRLTRNVCTQRLDMMHHIYLLLLQGRLHRAPLEDPQRVLDIGTGTGIWAIDFAEYSSPSFHFLLGRRQSS